MIFFHTPCIVSTPTGTLYILVASEFFGNANRWLEDLQFVQVVLIMYPCYVFAQYIYGIRLWLLYYDMKVTKFQNNKEWRKLIGDASFELQNWYLKNLHLFGNVSKLLIVCTILAIIECIFYGSFYLSKYYSLNTAAAYIAGITTCIRVTFAFCIYFKMNSLKIIDIFGIKKEMAIVTGIVFTFSIPLVYVLIVRLSKETRGDNENENTDENEDDITNSSLNSWLIIILTVLLSTIAILFAIVHYPKKCNESVNRRRAIIIRQNSKGDSNSQLAPSLRKEDSTPLITHWTDIVETEVGFEALMNYLSTEFSAENLLFITEVTFYIFALLYCLLLLFCCCFFLFRFLFLSVIVLCCIITDWSLVFFVLLFFPTDLI